MAFFQGAQSIKIVGGAFNNVEGNLVIHVHNNLGNNINSFNDNSIRISEQPDCFPLKIT